MKLHILTFIFFVGLARSAPTSDEDNLVISENFFPESLVIYTADYDIVKIVVPLNQLNFNDDDDSDNNLSKSKEDDDAGTTLFFVLADIKDNGDKDYKGLYVLKDKKAKKILDNGVDVTASDFGNNTKAYFAAKDGIYSYNYEKIEAEKYGTITDSIIGIAMENGTETMYILTENHELFNVTEDGNKKTKIDGVPYAEQFVLDYENNLYFYGKDKVPYVVNTDGVKKFEGVGVSKNYIQLLRPPFVIQNSVPIVVDDKTYLLYANGTVEETEVKVEVKPTAYSMEASLVQYYAHNKKIYEYNVLFLLISELLGEMKEFFNEARNHISRIASLSRSEFGGKVFK